MTPKQIAARKKAAREWQARRRAALHSAGLCVQCGHEYARENSTRCVGCLKYQAEKTNDYKRRKKVENDAAFGNSGACDSGAVLADSGEFSKQRDC